MASTDSMFLLVEQGIAAIQKAAHRKMKALKAECEETLKRVKADKLELKSQGQPAIDANPYILPFKMAAEDSSSVKVRVAALGSILR